MKVTIDPEKCLGTFRCVNLAPEVFDVDDDGNSFVVDADVSDELAAKVDLAVRSCPTGAISVED
ncbi:MAG: ferredoxin [Acidimicrobiia bacterium]